MLEILLTLFPGKRPKKSLAYKMFSAELKKAALKFLKSIKEKELLKRIGNKINELEKNPYPQDIERVEGYKNVKVFRVRVGDYRILYFVDQAANKIYVEKIDKRGRVYTKRK